MIGWGFSYMAHKIGACLVGLCALLLLVSPVQAILPADQCVVFHLREDPDDPESEVSTSIKVLITAVEKDGSSVGWRIHQVVFSRKLADNSEVSWEALLPEINTADGLWWTSHVDALYPTMDEFTVLPWMLGTADSLDGRYSDLAYDLAGIPDETPPEDQIYATTARLSYRLAADNPDDPVDDDNDDEPVEMPLPTNDPYLTQ